VSSLPELEKAIAVLAEEYCSHMTTVERASYKCLFIAGAAAAVELLSKAKSERPFPEAKAREYYRSRSDSEVMSYSFLRGARWMWDWLHKE
jgi:hypothetical protein